ncbi:MAG: hypothetical protein QMD71_03470 [bacterium]|nr:hypothetical protein [bacterium]
MGVPFADGEAVLKTLMNTDNPKLNFFIFHFLFFILLSGCGKKEPIGYEIVKPREGEIRQARGFVVRWNNYSEFASMSRATELFAGEECDFKAMAFICFEFDTTLLPDSLWLLGVNSGKVKVCKVTGLWNPDSINWSHIPDTGEIFDTVEIKEGDTCLVYIQDSVPDSVFSIGFLPYIGMASFKPLRLSVKEDTNFYSPSKKVYIDTSYFTQDLPMIETGAYTTQCTLWFSLEIPVFLKETTYIPIDSFLGDTVFPCTLVVGDSFITDTSVINYILNFKSATVNDASFYIPIDTTNSYKWDIGIYAGCRGVYSSSSHPKGDTLSLSIERIVDRWFKEGDCWLVLKGDAQKIGRVVFDIEGAQLSITYILPPKRRE